MVSACLAEQLSETISLEQRDLLVFIESFNFSFFSVTGWSIDLDYRDIEWFALETNRDHSVVFEIASKYCISDSFVEHDGYSLINNYLKCK